MEVLSHPAIIVVGSFAVLGIALLILLLIHLKNAVFYVFFRTIEFAVLYWLFTSGWPRVVAVARAWKVWDFAVQVTAVIYDFITSAMNSANSVGSPSEL